MTFGKLRLNDRFKFDHKAMSQARAANRPVEECIKVSRCMFRTTRYKELYLADSTDSVILIQRGGD